MKEVGEAFAARAAGGASSLFDLSGRVAIVTGATKGLGRSIAKGYARAGATVVVTGRKQPACESAARELAEESGGALVGMAAHMGDWDGLGEFAERVYERFPRVDVLVNNAGINLGHFEVKDLTEAVFDKHNDVNVKGPVRLAQLVAERMIADDGGGSIINVITVGAYNGGPGVGPYTSGKAALLNWTRTMAREWAPHRVRVNALAPGPFMTTMLEGAEKNQPGYAERAGSATLQKRVAHPDEIIGAALYLGSDASSYVTGEDHIVAGGMR